MPRRPPPQLRKLRRIPRSESRTHHAVLTLGRKPEHFRLGTRAMRFTDKESENNPHHQRTRLFIRYPRRSTPLCRQRQNPTRMVHRPLQNQERHKQRHPQRPKRLVREPSRPHHSDRAHRLCQCRIHQNH